MNFGDVVAVIDCARGEASGAIGLWRGANAPGGGAAFVTRSAEFGALRARSNLTPNAGSNLSRVEYVSVQ